MREVIKCLISWLDSVPSDQKSHKILRALAEESLQKVEFDEEKRKFTNREIVAAAKESIPDNKANKWVDWNNTVLPYWNARKKHVIAFAKKQGLNEFPDLGYHISSGGRGNESYYWLIAEPLPKENEEEQKSQSEHDTQENKISIHYEITEKGDVNPSWMAKWLFRTGEIHLSKRHIWALLIWLIMIGGTTVLLSYISWISLSIPKPVTTKEISAFISIFGIPYIIWVAFIKPWVRLFDDLIVPASPLLISIKEKLAQLELFRDGDLRIIRLVRYTATCPICGASIHLDDGSPDFPRRLVGRCSESPREHIFSFDRVTRKGFTLRSPNIQQ